MPRRLDWDKLKRKPKYEWVATTPEQKRRYRKRHKLNSETWQVARQRVQALADAAAPRGDRGNHD